MFTGEYSHTLDEKGRLALPAKFRDELIAGARACKWVDGCAAIFPLAGWEDLATKSAALPYGNRSARKFHRFLFGSVFDVKLDPQSRFVLPVALRDFLGIAIGPGITSEVTIVGARDHLEIWEPERWRQYSAEMDDPEVLAGHLQELGI